MPGHVFLSGLPAAKSALVLEGSRRARYPAGTLHYVPDGPDVADILEEGMIRVFVTSAAGRQATVRYVHRGGLVGPIGLLEVPPRGFTHAVTDVEVTVLEVPRLHRLLYSDAEVAMALNRDLIERFVHAMQTIAVRSFGTIRQKLAFDILDRACREQLDTGQLVCRHAGQQDLADAIGSVREVVSRNLRELRKEGLVATGSGFVKVLDPMGLERIAAEVLP